MIQVTVKNGEVTLRYTQRKDEPWTWDLEIKRGRKWLRLPNSPTEAPEVLMEVATACLQRPMGVEA